MKEKQCNFLKAKRKFMAVWEFVLQHVVSEQFRKIPIEEWKTVLVKGENKTYEPGVKPLYNNKKEITRIKHAGSVPHTAPENIPLWLRVMCLWIQI